jgi:hypothetical protein
MRERFFFQVFAFAVFFVFIFFPSFAQGKIGVGVGTAKIETNEDLKPGGIYELPPLTVRNTGDEFSSYAVDIQYHEGSPEHRPGKDWFEFSPREFDLAAGETQVVGVILRLPMKLEPGEYFAYVEAGPSKKSESKEGAVIGIAAAAKLYFKVVPSNIWQALWYKMIYAWKFYAPWTYVASIVIIVAILWTILGKFISFKFGFNRKGKKNEEEVSFEEALAESMKDLETYTENLSSREVDGIFNELGGCNELVEKYICEGDRKIFEFVGIETKKILILLKDSLASVEKKYPRFYLRAKETILGGFMNK